MGATISPNTCLSTAEALVTLGIVQAEAPGSNSFYAKHIHPIFDANCVTCHGEAKVKGGLRLGLV